MKIMFVVQKNDGSGASTYLGKSSPEQTFYEFIFLISHQINKICRFETREEAIEACNAANPKTKGLHVILEVIDD